MGNEIVILTPTYNRPENIDNLFSTLLEQTQKDFQWMIVDDGSPSSYTKVVEKIKSNADFEVKYYKKDNGGKSSAVNYALDKLDGKRFALIVDDDEFLNPDAVKIVTHYVELYKNSNVGVIHFNRTDMNGNIIAYPVLEGDVVMTFQTHKRNKYSADGYIGYFLDKVDNIRFPIFNNEKYIGPSVLFLLVSECYEMLWVRGSIGSTDYLEGGLTKKGKPLRMRSPRGMAARALLMQTKDSGIRVRFNYSIAYYAYLEVAGVSRLEMKTKNKCKPLWPILTKPLGYLLYIYWKNKYRL